MNSTDISRALEERYADYITFSEVKTGPSWAMIRKSLRIIDFIAIEKTWKPVNIIAIEIKVSRSDFLNDHKWVDALNVSNSFYWACPKGLISKEEVDSRCGLIYINDKGKARVYKKALYRDNAPDALMLLYLMFWRLEREEIFTENKRDIIIREMQEDKDVGEKYRYYVSESLTRMQTQLDSYRRKCEDIESELRKLDEFKQFIDKHPEVWRLVRQDESIVGSLSEFGYMVSYLRTMRLELDRLLKRVENA